MRALGKFEMITETTIGKSEALVRLGISLSKVLLKTKGDHESGIGVKENLGLTKLLIKKRKQKWDHESGIVPQLVVARNLLQRLVES